MMLCWYLPTRKQGRNAISGAGISSPRRARSIRVSTEQIAIHDVMNMRAWLIKMFGEIVNVSDSLIRRGRAVRFTPDTINILETMAHIPGLVKMTAEIINITDSMSGWLFRLIRLIVGVSRTVIQRLGISRMTISRHGISRTPTTRIDQEEIH